MLTGLLTRYRGRKHPAPSGLSRRRVVSFLLLLCFTGALLSAGAEERVLHGKTQMPPENTVRSLTKYELERNSMPDVDERRDTGLNKLFLFERSPLGNRTAVILMPGRVQEFQRFSWWKKCYRQFHDDPDFNRRYKLYVFVYHSRQPLPILAQAFREEMRRYFSPTDKTILVTYSLGGMIAKEGMTEPDIMDRVATNFGLAVPYHGSPIFDTEWFTKFMRPPNRSPIRRVWDRLLYRAYLFNNPNLTRDLGWDNFDGSQPQFDLSKTRLMGDQLVHESLLTHDWATDDPAFVQAFHKKTIFYGSYLENAYTQSNQPLHPFRIPKYLLDTTATLPKQLVGSFLPFYGFTVHAVMHFSNYQLSNLATFTPHNPRGENNHMYRFNDGAIPLSSMLYLPPAPEPYSGDLDSLVQASSGKLVRIFINADHTDIGHYNLRKSKLITRDVLHPRDGQRTPIEWILFDLKTLPEPK